MCAAVILAIISPRTLNCFRPYRRGAQVRAAARVSARYSGPDRITSYPKLTCIMTLYATSARVLR